MDSQADMFRMRRSGLGRLMAKTRSRSVERPVLPTRTVELGDLAPRRATTAVPVMSADGPLRFLVVCTANISRSPLAAALLDRHLRAAGVAAVVGSAGTLGTHLSVDEHSVTAGRELGVDLSDHRARALTAELVADEGRSLVITMERAHAREVALLDNDVWRRTFTLKELVRTARATRGDEADPHRWCAQLAERRSLQDLLGDDPSDDIADTYGTSLAVHRRTAAEFDELVARLVSAVPKLS